MSQIRHERFNGVNYKLVEEQDSWISIYEINDGLPDKPLIQARDIEHALEFCELREPIHVPFTLI